MKFKTQAAALWLLENAVIIDTETTGLGKDDQVMEIAAVEGNTGEILMNTLIQCFKEPHPEALALHGITSSDTHDTGITPAAMAFHLGRITTEKCKEKTSFNWPFDFRLMVQTLQTNNATYTLPQYATPRKNRRYPLCIMELANRHLIDHAEWSFERSQFKRLSLARCCEIAGIEFTGKAHRALPDAIAARDLLVAIAEGRV